MKKYRMLRYRELIRANLGDEVLCGIALPKARQKWEPYSKVLAVCPDKDLGKPLRVGWGDYWQVGEVRRPLKITHKTKK